MLQVAGTAQQESTGRMSKLLVLQHTEGEFLGLIEDHLEARRIAFQYLRPFADAAWQLQAFAPFDGLILLGGGPWGSAGERDLPSLAGEQEICAQYLADGLPVLGFGLGAQILARAAGGGSQLAPFRFKLEKALRSPDEEAAAFLPEEFFMVRYGRDRALPPPRAQILAHDGAGNPLVFQVGDNSFGFAGHPGVKSGIVEDLIMEFEEGPENAIAQLNELRAAHPELERGLHQIMIGLVERAGWMRRGGNA
jgi:GMP synthase-like glutamine amidotransferase